MNLVLFLLSGVFLPLFPLSWLFNRLVASAPGGWAKALSILVLPQLGVLLLWASGPWFSGISNPWHGLVAALALCTAILYAFRAISVREITIWARFMATSGLALAWLQVLAGVSVAQVQLSLLAWSIPGALLCLWAGELARRMGGAYIGLSGGVARVLPRLSALLATGALAATATPVFPGFFALLKTMGTLPAGWILFLLPVLFLWGWSIGRFLQDLLFGVYRGTAVEDLGTAGTWAGALVLLVFAITGLFFWGATWTVS